MNRMRRFSDTGLTPQDFHKMYAFPPNARCSGCRTPKVAVRAIVYMPVVDAIKKGIIPQSATLDQIHAITLQLNDNGTRKYFIRTTMAYACEQCAPAMERMLARDMPSSCVCDINRGPDPTNRVSVGFSAGIAGLLNATAPAPEKN